MIQFSFKCNDGSIVYDEVEGLIQSRLSQLRISSIQFIQITLCLSFYKITRYPVYNIDQNRLNLANLTFKSSQSLAFISDSSYVYLFHSQCQKNPNTSPYPSTQYNFIPTISQIATYNQYYIISGGGGGKTGIKNEILIFRHKIENNKPIFTLQTSNKIIENLQVSPEKKVIFASANDMVKVYEIVHGEEHITLKEKHQWKADHALKNSTIYSLAFHPLKNILCTAGEDMIVRFFTLDQSLAPSDKYFEQNLHSNPLKNVDHNNNNLFLSCDTHQIIITDVQTRKPLRKLFCDQLQPQNSLFQATYFLNPNEQQLLICHYILRKAAYVSKQFKGGKLETKEITTDQSCLTSYSKPLKLLGIACGNGSTHLVQADNLSKAGTEHNHAFVITGGTISRGGRFVTGTPQCSYHIQQTDSPMLPCSFIPLVALTFTLLIIFFLGSAITLPDITLSDL